MSGSFRPGAVTSVAAPLSVRLQPSLSSTRPVYRAHYVSQSEPKRRPIKDVVSRNRLVLPAEISPPEWTR